MKFRLYFKSCEHMDDIEDDSIHFIYTSPPYWGACYDTQTEVLTRYGWKYFNELNKTDEIATLNKNNELEYQMPLKLFSYNYKGKMFHVCNSQFIDLLVTPNHKMYVKVRKDTSKNGKRFHYWTDYSLIEAKNIFRQHVKYQKDTKWNGTYVKYFNSEHSRIPIKEWLEFFGYFTAEGSTTERDHRTAITQSTSSKHFSSIEKCLDKLPFKWKYDGLSFVCYDIELFNYLKQFGKSHEKFIPCFIKGLTSDLINCFLQAYWKGDGYSDNRRCSTTSKRLADDLQELIFKSGNCSNISERDTNDSLIKGRLVKGKHKKYIVSLIRNHSEPSILHHNKFGSKNEYLDYDGLVYCVEVPNHIIYVRRNGKSCWSGNSMWNEQWASLGIDIEDQNKGFEEFHDYLAKIWKECYRVLMPGCRCVINVGDIDGKPGAVYGRWPNGAATIYRCRDIGFIMRENIIWQKPEGTHLAPLAGWPSPGRLLWPNLTEHNIIFEKKGSRDLSKISMKLKKGSQLDKKMIAWMRTNVWKIRTASAKREKHIAPFPEMLPDLFIQLHTYVGDWVLDPFMGSGTTMKVARNRARNCVGYELDENYKEIILKKVRAKIGTIGHIDSFYIKNADDTEETWDSGYGLFG